MPADVYSNGLGVLLMGTGNDNNSWGVNANSGIFQILEDAISGALWNTVTGGTLDLSIPAPPNGPSQVRYSQLVFTGTISGTQTIKVPGISKMWLVRNYTSADIYMIAAGGTVTICIPVNTDKIVFSDGVNVHRLDANEVGNIEMFAGQSVPPGKMECTGASLLGTSYPDLYGKIGVAWGGSGGYFNLPLMTDTGRFPRSRQPGVTEAGIAWNQANQTAAHAHTGSVSITSYGGTDAQGNHSHNISAGDYGHQHNYTRACSQNNQKPASGGTAPFDTYQNNNTDWGYANIYASADYQGTHSHNVSVSGSGSFTTSTNGSGSETRPEASVFRFCIRY